MGVNLRKAPRTAEDIPVNAPTFEETAGVSPHWTGYLYTAVAGATNIFDEKILVSKRLRGGWYEILDSNALIGDYVEFSVVDKDDVLGLFTPLGLTVGEDVLELKKYVQKEYVNPEVHSRQEFIGNSAFYVVAGLYIRSIYESTGSQDVQFKSVILSYE